MRTLRRLSLPAIIAGVAFLLCSIISVVLFARTMRGSPHAAMDPESNRIDLGSGEPGQELDGSFWIRNSGTKLMEFSIETSCGCSLVRPQKGTVEPGQAQSVDLAIRLPDFSNSDKSISGIIKTNDPARPELHFIAVARALAPIVASPAHVDFGAVSSGDLKDAVRLIEIRSVDDGIKLENVRIDSDTPFARVERRIEEPGRMILTVALTGAPPSGEVSGTIDLSAPESKHRIRIPLHARVADGITIAPSVAVLRRDSSLLGFKPTTVIMTRHSGVADWQTISLLKAPTWLSIASIHPLNSDHCRVLLSALMDSQSPQENADIEFSIATGQTATLRIITPALKSADP